jgi:hypothetical protein
LLAVAGKIRSEKVMFEKIEKFYSFFLSFRLQPSINDYVGKFEFNRAEQTSFSNVSFSLVDVVVVL